MKKHSMSFMSARGSRAAGFTLVEMMIALGLGMLLVAIMTGVYLSSKSAFRRQEQLNTIQQSVRIAFEYISNDARMVDHRGCFTGRPTGFISDGGLAASALATNFAIGIEGYEYTLASNAYTMSSESRADVASGWATNAVGVTNIPVGSGQELGAGLSPGSDVLVLRSTAGQPVRLTAPVAAAANAISVLSTTGNKCSSGTASASGFCSGSYGLIANCTDARTFKVSGTPTVSGTTTSLSLGTTPAPALVAFPQSGAEVFPLQTSVYYVKKSSSGVTTSLYRRVFDGTVAGGVEQELIEGVENMQITYGRDTSVTPDGAVDDYVTANAVTPAFDWSKVVAVRVSLLVRAADPVDADTKLATSTSAMNKTTITYPTGSKYDRRVFTTTVAIRNKIAYF